MDTDRVALEERRLARAEWLAAGGSQRRPLKSFRTQAEKRAARIEHADRITEAVQYIRTDRGFSDWLDALERCPRFSPLNAALIAHQAPGQVVDTAQGWKRNGYPIRKGETACGYITGAMFWPMAIFTADQADAGDIADYADAVDVPVPDDVTVSRVRGILEDALNAGRKGREAVELAVAALERVATA